MKSFRAVSRTEHCVIPDEDIDVIFYKITDLHRVHYDFIRELEPVIENWSADTCIAPQFKILVSGRNSVSYVLVLPEPSIILLLFC